MHLVISRFKVANGMEAEVRQAFLDRPHLVDDVPGFLGMEVYQESEDPSAFYLVTRWTDLENYQIWHRSEAHRESHQFIPKGLKLASGFTEIRRLERIASQTGPEPEERIMDTAPMMAAFLKESRTLFRLELNPDGIIRSCSSAFSRAVQIPTEELPGRNIREFLTDPDAAALMDRIHSRSRDYEQAFLLNCVDSRNHPFTIECRCDVQPTGVTLIAEPAEAFGSQLQSEWLELNNALALMTRELARKNKDLTAIHQELESSLADLEQSHWQIRKISEVLPFCMECGDVKVGGSWQKVIDFLKAHSRFLSHGYCPACADRVMKSMGLPAEGETT
jgi:heme oxygenase (mycobilin-producing)